MPLQHALGLAQVHYHVNQISFGSGFYLNPRRNISDFAHDASVELYAPKPCAARIILCGSILQAAHLAVSTE